jgi:hypothetical protein
MLSFFQDSNSYDWSFHVVNQFFDHVVDRKNKIENNQFIESFFCCLFMLPK